MWPDRIERYKVVRHEQSRGGVDAQAGKPTGDSRLPTKDAQKEHVIGHDPRAAPRQGQGHRRFSAATWPNDADGPPVELDSAGVQACAASLGHEAGKDGADQEFSSVRPHLIATEAAPDRGPRRVHNEICPVTKELVP